jgi:hypothetical protein
VAVLGLLGIVATSMSTLALGVVTTGVVLLVVAADRLAHRSEADESGAEPGAREAAGPS